MRQVSCGGMVSIGTKVRSVLRNGSLVGQVTSFEQDRIIVIPENQPENDRHRYAYLPSELAVVEELLRPGKRYLVNGAAVVRCYIHGDQLLLASETTGQTVFAFGAKHLTADRLLQKGILYLQEC